MRRIIIAVALLITGLTQATAQKSKRMLQDSTHFSYDSAKPKIAIYTFNEEQLVKLNTALQLGGQSEILNNSDQFSTKQRNQMYGFMDSMAGVVIRQLMAWHPAPPPPKKQDSTIKKP